MQTVTEIKLLKDTYTLSQKTLDEHVKSYVVSGNSLIIII